MDWPGGETGERPPPATKHTHVRPLDVDLEHVDAGEIGEERVQPGRRDLDRAHSAGVDEPTPPCLLLRSGLEGGDTLAVRKRYLVGPDTALKPVQAHVAHELPEDARRRPDGAHPVGRARGRPEE